MEASIIAAARFSMNVAIRVDASHIIGSGHVMRCLALADALRAQGAAAHFICRAHDNHLAWLIRGERYACTTLDSASGEDVEEIEREPLPPHAAWLGSSWRRDVEETAQVLTQTFDWLVVDHYALDWRWESALRPLVGNVMVIDDLSDRRHDCDVLLNSVHGKCAEDYRELTPPGCRFLLGPEFSMLRAEFAERRRAALQRRRETDEVRRVLIAFGGMDPDNLTARALEQVVGVDLPVGAKIDVVLGSGFSRAAGIRKQAEAAPVETKVAVAVDNMAERMTLADLGVGAGGVSAWERCCLGLPSVTVVTAENQMPNAAALREEQVSEVVLPENFVRDFRPAFLRATRDRAWYRQAALRAAALCDGQGAVRVADALIEAG